MQRPTAAPRIPASESGVSTQRSGPEPVAQARRRPEDAAEAPDVLADHHHRVVARELDVQRVVDRLDEEELARRHGRRAHPCTRRARRGRARAPAADRRTHARRRARGRPAARSRRPRSPARIVASASLANRRDRRVVEQAEPPQVALEHGDAVALLLRRDAVRVDVEARVVRRRVRRRAIGDRLDERRAAARAGARDRLAHRLVDGEHVVAVDRARRASRSRPPCRRAAPRRSARRAASRSPTGCCCRAARAAPS